MGGRAHIRDTGPIGRLVEELEDGVGSATQDPDNRAPAGVARGDVGDVVDLADDLNLAAVDRRRTDVDVGVENVDVGEAKAGDLAAVFCRLDEDRSGLGAGPGDQGACVQGGAAIDHDVLADDRDVAAVDEVRRRIELVPDDVHRPGFERDVAPVEDEVLADTQHFVEAVADVERRVGQLQHVIGVGRRGAGEIDPVQRRVRHARARAGDDDLRRPGADVDMHFRAGRQTRHVDAVFGSPCADDRAEQGVEPATGGQDDRACEGLGIDRVDSGAAAELGRFDPGQGVGLAPDHQTERREHHVGVALLDQGVDAAAAVDRVVAEAAGDPVVAGAADDDVVAATADQNGLGRRDRRAGERAAAAAADDSEALAGGRAIARGDAERARTGARVGDDDRGPCGVERGAEPRVGAGDRLEDLRERERIAEVDIDPGAVGQRHQQVAGSFRDRRAGKRAATARAEQAKIGGGCRCAVRSDLKIAANRSGISQLDRGAGAVECRGDCRRGGMDRRENLAQRRGCAQIHQHGGPAPGRQVEGRTVDPCPVVQHTQRHRGRESGHVDSHALGRAEAQAAVERLDLGGEVQPAECRDVDRVRARAAGQLGELEAGNRVDHAVGRQRRVRQREIHVARLDQGIESDPTVDRVGATVAGDTVVPGAAAQAVRAAGTDENVVARAAAQHHRTSEGRGIEQVGAVRAVDLDPLDIRQHVEQGRALRRDHCTDATTRQVDRRGRDVRLIAPALLADEGDDPGPADGRLADEHVALVNSLEPHQGALHVLDVGVPGDGIAGLTGEFQIERAAGDRAVERDRDDLAGAFGEVERRAHCIADEQTPCTELDRRVDPAAAVEGVEPRAARQEVVARAALQDVVACAAVEGDRAEREG